MNDIKISLIGSGNIGGNLAYLASLKGLATKIVMLDINANVAKGKALDISQALPIDWSNVSITGTSNYADIEGSDVIIITAGVPRKPGMSREDLIQTNADVMKVVAQNIKSYAPKAFVVVVTNPLDAMAWVVKEVTGFSRKMVVGMAGILDSVRLRVLLAKELKVSAESINALVLGSHGDSMVPLLRYSTVAGIPISEFIKFGMITAEKIKEIVEKTRNGGAEVVNLLQTSAYYAPAASAMQIVSAYLHNKHLILPCSTFLDGEYGAKNVYCGVPVVIGNTGVEKILEIDLNAEESSMFNKSVALSMDLLKSVKI